MEVLDVIRKRRSIREYRPDRIPEDVLDRLLEALRLAPTGGNRQPFKFIVVQDKETRGKVAAACRWVPGRPDGHGFIAEAPVVIVACGSEKDAVTRFYKDGHPSLIMGVAPDAIDKEPHDYNNLMAVDLAIALDHLTLVATEEGLGTCWIAALDERELKNILSVPDDMRVLFVMPIGYAISWPEPRPRKALKEIICRDSYS
ncbi:MAG: nitroreductase family protein [Dehalococcoidales bacterium]|nr:nitroreductase family protein [Dehalococcoidales bacterium]